MTWDKTEANLRQLEGYSLVRTNPFGFWKIVKPDGDVLLNEEFTSLSLAEKTLTQFLGNAEKKTKKGK